MSLDLIKNNIEREKALITELSINLSGLESSGAQKSSVERAIEGELAQLKALNNALPSLLENISFYNATQETTKKQSKEITNINYIDSKENKNVDLAIKKKDQISFLEGLTKEEKIKKPVGIMVGGGTGFIGAYIRLSNTFFRDYAENLVGKNYFNFIKVDLRKTTSKFLIHTYLSMMFFTVLISTILGLLLGIPLFFLGISIYVPILLIIGLPLITFGSFLLYPSSQRESLEKGINNELPFVTIYMAAIASSGIEPTKIFSILVKTKDYPSTEREIKKLLNYINFYGYDLVGALRQSSKTSPSERLALLFNGLAATISTGGELSTFLEKHAEGLLFDYRLEREKYTKIAETFMDIYISIVIAAPMIMMILFVLISLTGYSSGLLSPGTLNFLTILIVGLLNIGFLLFLNVRQPKF